MTEEELKNIQSTINDASIRTMKRIGDIIESELKEVAEKFGVGADRLVLNTYPFKDNTQKYEVLIRMSGFTISHTYTLNGEPIMQPNKEIPK